jgi:uncharacterized membrane protein YraQ (UPF0718 family)
MTDSTGANVGRVTPYRAFIAVSAAVLLVLIALFPAGTLETAAFVARSMVSIAPLVIPGILLSAWVSASGAGAHVAALFGMRPATAILAASAVGAITPVCGVTVLPLMAGLLASGVPLAPVMAFWLSSPVTDPAMLTVTAATLGWEFAIAKTAAAFGLGLFGGLVTAAIRTPDWTANPLRRTGLAARLSSSSCGEQQAFGIAIWRDRVSRRAFVRECVSITRLVTICLVPAFAAEYMLNALLQPESLTAYVGSGTWWSIPLAVFVGAPAYRPDAQLGDPVLFALHDDEALAVEGEGLFLGGNGLRLVNDEAGDGRRLLVGQVPVERAVDVADRYRAVDDDRAVGLLAHALHVDIVLVGDVADNFLDDVLQRDEAFHLAIFVDDEGDMGLAAQKGIELVAQASSCRARTRACWRPS